MRPSIRIVLAGALIFCAPVLAAAGSPPAPASTKAPPPSKPEGTPATVLDDQKVETVIGQHITGASGEDMGPIVNVIVNREGQVRAALIDFGGFLGVGSRRIAVDWRALHFNGKGEQITTSLTRDQVRLAPEYKVGQPLVVLGTPTASTVTANSKGKQQSKPPQPPPPKQPKK